MKNNFTFITDNNYVKPTIIAISSLAESCKKHLCINILGVDLSFDNICLLNSLQQQFLDINVIEAQAYLSNLQILQQNRHVTKAAALKFFLPEIFKNLDNIFYLDSDLVIQEDITDIFDIDITNCYGAVVKDFFTISNKNYLKEHNINNEFYFNSGVMYLNLKKMRQDDITKKFIEYKTQNDTLFMDQDAFNAVIGHNVKYLSYKYNFLNYYLTQHNKENLGAFFESDFVKTDKEIYDSCKIIHFGGNEKPWIYSMLYLSNIYLQYKEKSILKDEHWILKKEYNEFMYDKIIKIIQENSTKKIMFWGASKFLENILANNVNEFDGVLGIIDKNIDKKCIGGLQIFPPQNLENLKPDIIILSIKNNSKKIYNELKEFLSVDDSNIQLINIFAEE